MTTTYQRLTYKNRVASRFHRTNAPNQQEITEMVHTVSHRVAGFLQREGILERDEDDCMDAGGRAKQEPEPKTAT
jgi:S-ribosylhomocysteine lyase LuxS involved in autoinducer biosynthesis